MVILRNVTLDECIEKMKQMDIKDVYLTNDAGKEFLYTGYSMI